MEVTVIVLVGEEARLSIDASLDEVHRYPCKLDSWAAWHGQGRIDAMLFGSRRHARRAVFPKSRRWQDGAPGDIRGASNSLGFDRGRL